MTENEVITVIDNVANRLARRFKFGYHDINDIKQQARLFALEGISNYDNKRPLENFLWTHVKNRLCNFKRDNYERPIKPCLECNEYDISCNKFVDLDECEYYRCWIWRNKNKKNLMNPADISLLNNEDKNINILDSLNNKELIDIIEQNLPIIFRSLFLKLKFGIKISKVQKSKLITIINQILEEHGYSKT